jgi:hypothetical protein
LFFFVISIICADATVCQGDTIYNTHIDDTVEFKQKNKINSICSRSQRNDNFTFLEIEIIDFPKGIFEIVTRPYEFAFKMTKTGKYTIKYRHKLKDRYGKIGFINYIMYVEVVENAW